MAIPVKYSPKMKQVSLWPVLAVLFLFLGASGSGSRSELLLQHRNLGKAFYENPTTQVQAVEEFKKALDLAPDSPRERLNYGLALLRAGKTKEGVAELEKAQKQEPAIPHSWFNLGIAFKKDGQYPRALQQLEQMVRLVPDEPVAHYNLAVLYKLSGKPELALKHFETASNLDPNLAGPHFQLYNAYRQAGRSENAARELKVFQEIKKRTAGAAVPEDMEWCYYAEIYETVKPELDNSPPAELRFDKHNIAAGFDPPTSGLIVLDADGDGRPDLIAWSANVVQLFKNGSTLVPNSGLAGLKDVVSIAAGDFDNDGLPDLCVLAKTGAALYKNQKGTFHRHPAQLPEGRYEKAVWLDYDHDYDLDLFLLGEKSALVRNNGEAGFSDQSAGFPFVNGPAVDATVYRLVADTKGSDLVVSYRDRGGVLYRDKLAGKYEAMPLDPLPAGAKSILAFDLNHDGWTDLVADSPSGTVVLVNERGKLVQQQLEGAKGTLAFADLENRGVSDLIAGGSLYRNHVLGRLQAAKAGIPAAAACVKADFDGDGRLDLAVIAMDGSLQLLKNQTATNNHWLQTGLIGVKNLKLASGAEVEVKAGSLYQKQVYEGVPLLFGLRSHREADTVRITWPNGLIQNEPKQLANRAQKYQEAQRLSGSCPMIFAWNGSKFEFITDVLGVAPLGASSGDGKYFPVDHDEYIQIPGESLALLDGRYQIRITEELHEVSYLDQVRLIAVDHPSTVEILTNEKFKSPPFPEFRLFGAEKRIYPRAARDHHGQDIRSAILKRDRIYPDGFRRDYSGVAELHAIELDFGKTAPDNRAVLILNGWVDWADGSTFLNASQQSNAGLIFPYLQVKDPNGSWQTVIPDMGIPAGKPKTIAVDLSGKFLSSSRQVRIVTNLCVYWDEIFLSEMSGAPRARLTPMGAESAELRFHGFSRPAIHPERLQPESFDYTHWMPASAWNPTPGRYTRYGDVQPLLQAVDDQFVIMGSGDELRLRFPARQMPPLPTGWKRDFLLLVDGWAKDADANTAYSQTVEPLPFHRMTSYPYPSGEHFPTDEAHRRYLETYNTRPALRLIRPLAELQTR